MLAEHIFFCVSCSWVWYHFVKIRGKAPKSAPKSTVFQVFAYEGGWWSGNVCIFGFTSKVPQKHTSRIFYVVAPLAPQTPIFWAFFRKSHENQHIFSWFLMHRWNEIKKCIFGFTVRVPRMSYYEVFLHGRVLCTQCTFKHRFLDRFRIIIDSGPNCMFFRRRHLYTKLLSFNTLFFTSIRDVLVIDFL